MMPGHYSGLDLLLSKPSTDFMAGENEGPLVTVMQILEVLIHPHKPVSDVV